MLDNTWIFFVTDNGYMLGEHRLSRKETPYEECVGHPFVVTGPGVRAGRALAEAGHHGRPDADHARGRRPRPGRGSGPGRAVLAGTAHHGRLERGWRTRMLTELPLKNWAHLHEDETVLIDHYAAGEQEVYDMAADPHQMSSQHATTDTTAMTARLTALRNARGQALRALEV